MPGSLLTLNSAFAILLPKPLFLKTFLCVFPLHSNGCSDSISSKEPFLTLHLVIYTNCSHHFVSFLIHFIIRSDIFCLFTYWLSFSHLECKKILYIRISYILIPDVPGVEGILINIY